MQQSHMRPFPPLAALFKEKAMLGVATSLPEIEAIATDWENIVQQSDELDLFVSPSWMMPWYQTVMSHRDQPAVVWVKGPDGRLVGVLPLVRRRRYLGPVPVTLYESAGDAVVCGDHLGLVASTRDFAYVYDQVRNWLLTQVDSGALIRLVALDEGGQFATLMQHDVEKHKVRWRYIMPQIAPRLKLPNSYDAFELLLNSRRRKLIRRNWRHIERDYGITLSCYTNDSASLESVLAEWFELHDSLWASRGQHTALENVRLRQFLQQFCQEAAQRGWLRLYQIRVNQQLVAGTIIFHWQDRAYYYQLAWDPAFADYGIGELIITHSIRTAIDEGLSLFDFLRGEEQYKFRLRAQPYALIGLEFACRGPAYWLLCAGRMRERIGQTVRRLKGTAKAKPQAGGDQLDENAASN